jgi:hypothetical protein
VSLTLSISLWCLHVSLPFPGQPTSRSLPRPSRVLTLKCKVLAAVRLNMWFLLSHTYFPTNRLKW